MMNKVEFLAQLRSELSVLPKEDIEKSLDYYSEIIEDRIEEGLSESEAVEACGEVSEIASLIISDMPLSKLVKAKMKPSRTLKAWEIVLIVLGSPIWLSLLLAVAAVVLSVYIILWSFIVLLYAVDAAIAACSFALVFGTFSYLISGGSAQGVLCLGLAFVCAGLSVLLFFAFNKVTKGVLFLSRKILRNIKARFVRKEK